MNKSFNSKRYSQDFPVNKIEEIRIAEVLKIIGTKKKVLDLGCGDGFFMERIKNMDNEVTGIEISENAIIKARNRGFKVYDVSLENNWSEKISDKFDIIFGGEIIEHVFDTDNFLKNIKNLLKEGGSLIITTPNIASLGRRLLLLLGKNPLIETTARENDAGHIRYFTRDSLGKLLMENDFKIITMTSSVVNFSSFSDGFFSRFLAKTFPTFGNNIIVAAKKNDFYPLS